MNFKRSRVNFDNFTISLEKGEKLADNIDKLKPNMPVGRCPLCNEKLVIRNGKNGKFIGCSGFKNGCTQTYNITNFKASKDFEITGHIKGFEIYYGSIGL